MIHNVGNGQEALSFRTLPPGRAARVTTGLRPETADPTLRSRNETEQVKGAYETSLSDGQWPGHSARTVGLNRTNRPTLKLP